MTLGSRNVTPAFGRGVDGDYVGVVSGLANGDNVLTARLPSGWGARLKITGHAIGGAAPGAARGPPLAPLARPPPQQGNPPAPHPLLLQTRPGGGGRGPPP